MPKVNFEYEIETPLDPKLFVRNLSDGHLDLLLDFKNTDFYQFYLFHTQTYTMNLGAQALDQKDISAVRELKGQAYGLRFWDFLIAECQGEKERRLEEIKKHEAELQKGQNKVKLDPTFKGRHLKINKDGVE